ncbi:MAG: tetratricopeptide repeat protein, partial [Acidobacteria bacterium]|nr:tetratricopeptide repeat protein [Acidobacteriota bacterium]
DELLGLAVDRWYRAVEGSGLAEPWTPPAGPPTLAKKEAHDDFSPHAPLPSPPIPGRTFLLQPLPLFELPYRSVEGEPVAVPEDLGGPVLIDLWASWCANCRSELKELQTARGELAGAGIDVLALAVDEPKDQPAAQAFLDEIGWTFPRGVAEPELLDLLTLAYQTVVDLPRGMALPMSFLVDRRHRLLAIYRGPVSSTQVQADVSSAASSAPAALPFAGRWAAKPEGRDLQHFANLLRSRGYGARAVAYLELQGTAEQAAPWRRKDLVRSWVEASQSLLAEGRVAEAQAASEKGLAIDPQSPELHQMLGRSLLEQGRIEPALTHLETALRDLPEDPALRVNFGLALARGGRSDEAATQFEAALERVVKGEEAELKALYNLAVYRESKGQRAEARALLDRCLAGWPRDFEALHFLGVLEQRAGHFPEAIAAYRRALEVQPEDARTVYYLGRAYLSAGKTREAELQYRRLLELGHPSAERL